MESLESKGNPQASGCFEGDPDDLGNSNNHLREFGWLDTKNKTPKRMSEVIWPQPLNTSKNLWPSGSKSFEKLESVAA